MLSDYFKQITDIILSNCTACSIHVSRQARNHETHIYNVVLKISVSVFRAKRGDSRFIRNFGKWLPENMTSWLPSSSLLKNEIRLLEKQVTSHKTTWRHIPTNNKLYGIYWRMYRLKWPFNRPCMNRRAVDVWLLAILVLGARWRG